MGFNNNIKTRSLIVFDLLNNDNLLPNNNNSSRIVAYATGLSQNYFINPPIINQSLNISLKRAKYFTTTSQRTMNNRYILLWKQKIFSKQPKIAAQNS